MKSRYSITVTDRNTGDEVLSLDIDAFKYHFEAGRDVTLFHLAPNGTTATEYVRKSKATFTINGTLSTLEELPCNHDWSNYKGLEEEYEYCKHCGKNRDAL